MTTEHQLCIKLRIRLVERLAEVDLPGFLFEQLDQILSELTYFKLMNLWENYDALLEYLNSLANSYNDEMFGAVSLNQRMPYATHIYQQYVTDRLLTQHRKPSCGLKDLLKIKQRYLVMFLLKSKEFMYKKQKKQLPTSVADLTPSVN